MMPLLLVVLEGDKQILKFVVILSVVDSEITHMEVACEVVQYGGSGEERFLAGQITL
jgi:hypothetical protein